MGPASEKRQHSRQEVFSAIMIMAVDHLGVQFDPAQEDRIQDLLDVFGRQY